MKVGKYMNAWALAAIDPLMHRVYGDRKQSLMIDLPDTIVEIGPGAGPNFRYYPSGARVVAIEPNEAQHARLRTRAAKTGLEIDLLGTPAEAIPLADASADLVVSTLVLCSVSDPERVLSEVKRVLRPGGRFVFIEHVAAPEGSRLARVQKHLARPWAFLFDGCRIDRRSGDLIERTFGRTSIAPFRLRPRWLPVSPHVAGVAERASLPDDTMPQ
jgi:ubiquinone/menaquinone biosynthesis C-methylase UbiE